MKKILFFIFAVACVFIFSGFASAGSKTLIAYFSWSGNTRMLAQYVAEATGCEIFEIKTKTPYTQNYDVVLDVAKNEQNRRARPELASHVENMEQYDTIFLGYPCWWGTMPMAVFTFLEEYDFSRKRVIPFVTHGGSSFGRSLNDMRRTIPNAKIEINGLSVNGSSVSGSRKRVLTWLEGLGFAIGN